MTDNETVNVIRSEIDKSPFAKSYTISGSILRSLMRMSEYAVTRQIIMNSLREKNDRLRSQLSQKETENEKLKSQLQNRTGELV